MRKKLGWALLLLFALLFRYGLVYTAAAGLDILLYSRVDETQKADVAIVLGAATWDGQLSPVFAERVHHGLWLYDNGYVGKLLFTGGLGAGNTLSDAAVAGEYALARGVPSEDILLEECSTITQENIAFSAKIMAENGLFTALLVSDPLHMRRAILMAADYDINAFASPTPTTRYQSFKTQLGFWAREVFYYIGYRGWRLFNL